MKKNIALLLSMLLAFGAVGCSEKSAADKEDTSLAETTEGTTADVFEGVSEVTDIDAIGAAYQEYKNAVSATIALKEYSVNNNVTVVQTSTLEDFNTKRTNLSSIDIKGATEGAEELKSSITDVADEQSNTITLYYKDKTVYTVEGEYKVKTPEQDFSALNPRYADVITGLTFDETAITGIKQADNHYSFSLKPDAVTFGDVYSVPKDGMTGLSLVFSIEDGTISESSFTYTVATTAKDIQEGNREMIESQGGTVEEIKDEDNADVTVNCTATTVYSNINNVTIDFPDFSDFKTYEEISAEMASAQAAETTEAVTE